MEFEVESKDAEGVKHTYLMVRFPVTDSKDEIVGTGLGDDGHYRPQEGGLRNWPTRRAFSA